MAKKNGKIKIQEERAKRQATLAMVQQEKAQTQAKLGQLINMEQQLIGALDQLDALEGIKPEASDNGAPVKKKVLEKSVRRPDKKES